MRRSVFQRELVVKKLLSSVDRFFDWVVHGFIIYLVIGELLFLTVGWILPTFIF